MSDFSNPIFHDEEKARQWLENELWPKGPVCPKCGAVNEATLMQGESHRPGLYQCNACRQPFTVTIGTLYERSHVPLHKWLAATHLLMSSKKGMSALQVGRLLQLNRRTAWFLCHRIRESLRPTDLTPMGGEGKTVEADETFVGGKEKNRHRGKRFKTHAGGNWGKETVFSLVERGGQVRSVHTPSVTAATLRPILVAQLDAKTFLMTDDAGQYRHMHRDFRHETVNHGIGEYVRGPAHTKHGRELFFSPQAWDHRHASPC